jgi:DNA-binding Lrp family transcriptional regulator
VAFVLIRAELGAEEEVTESLKNFEEIKEVYEVFSVYDLIVRVEAESKPELKDTIFTKIRHMENVRSLLTLFVDE